MTMKVVTVVGARPQFVKAAVLSRVLAGIEGFSEVLVHTGQHYDKTMSEVFFLDMEIPTPDYRLQVRASTHGAMTGRMLEAVENVLIQEAPDAVIVYGDTNTTLSGALAAAKLHIPLIHVEAGLRSFDMNMPEEVNRALTDRVSQVLFCPTRTAVTNLENEGIAKHEYEYDLLRNDIPQGLRLDYNMPACVALTGDIMQDAAFYYGSRSAEKSNIISELGMSGEFALCTIHRAENTDKKASLSSLCQGLLRLRKWINIVMPLHPRTQKRLQEHGLSLPDNVVAVDPLGYFDMLELLKACSFVLTDSGGLQKEAFFFDKPCITLRDRTEWVELVEQGANKLVHIDPDALEAAAHSFLEKPPICDQNLYGNGRAGERMARILSSFR